MILGHIMGMPVEETVVQLGPAGVVAVTVVAIATRTKLRRALARIKEALTEADHRMRRRARYS